MKRNIILIGTAIIFTAFLFTGCTTNTYSTTTDPDDSSYISGKGSAWDEEVNDIYDEYGEDVGLTPEEIDAAMRAIEQG